MLETPESHWHYSIAGNSKCECLKRQWIGQSAAKFHCKDVIKIKPVEQLAPYSRKSVVCICEVCGYEYFEVYRNITRSKFADKYCEKCRIEVKRDNLSKLKTEFYKSVAGEKVKQHLSLITKKQAKSKIGAFSKENRRKQANSLSKVHSNSKGPYAQHVFKVTRGSAHPNWKNDKEDYEEYKSNVYSETLKWDLYSLEGADKRGLCGTPFATQLDHKLSIYYGYSHNIDPKIVGHICNLEFVSWKENRAKGKKCSISLRQLLTKIEKYNETSSTTIPKGSRI